MSELSILIPSRNEPYLKKTLDDLFEHSQGETDVIIGLDGWTDDVSWTKELIGRPRIKIVYETNSIGQRAMTNSLARMSDSKYLMKIDAHCSFSDGFDISLMAEMDDKTILSPLLLPLDGISWSVNGRKQMAQFVFGDDFIMVHKDGDVGETMCLQGSAWMITRDNYWKWNACDETLGSWGGQAVELGITSWINGGRCKTTRAAYYGHVFRHSDQDFPYNRGQNPGKFATEELKKRYENDDRVKELRKRFTGVV